MKAAALSLWKGQTTHKRFVPFERRFSYSLVLIDIDIDRLEEADKCSSLFTINRPGLYSFYSRDHGDRQDGASLRTWAESHFLDAEVDLQGGAVRLVTFPRHFLYKFAPLSLWFGYGPDDQLRGVLYEVNNTFGETHTYAAKVSEGRNTHAADKNFHVSPFFDVTGKYAFTVRSPTDKLDVVVDSSNDGQRLHMANIKAARYAATRGNLLKFAVTNPLSTLGVTLAIHWQALLLWKRGARYRPKPAPPGSKVTRATETEKRSNYSKDAA